MPVISRDQIKEGYVRTFGKSHAELPEESNLIATNIFFDALKGLTDSGVSVIAEAAFQHKIWAPRLAYFTDRVQIYLLICQVPENVALDRFIQRGLDNPSREYFHGDRGVEMARQGIAPSISPYDEPRLDVPTFHIDTLGEYHPSVQELREMIFEVRTC